MRETKDSVVATLKSVTPTVLPFFKTVALYFVLADSGSSSLLLCLLKCAPIACLLFCVLYHRGRSQDELVYSRRIIFGLICSLIGDAFLVGREFGLFLPGLIAFALAHICYAHSFGFKPLHLWLLPIPLCLILPLNLIVFLPLNGIMSIACAIYSLIIAIMIWRAIAVSIGERNLCSLTSASRILGSIFFGMSDCLLAINEFYHPLPLSGYSVMITYYFAQLGIAMSAVFPNLCNLKEISP